MTKWEKTLRSLGFTESETSIYLLSLEIGPSPVQDLARRAGVSRMTTYTAIESLKKRGLMSSVEKGKKTLYAAENADRLVSFVEAKKREAEATLQDVLEAIDELRLKQRGEKPIVKMFEGPEALRSIEKDILETKPKRIDEFGNLDEIRKFYADEPRAEFLKEIAQMQHVDRLIALTSKPIAKRSAKPGAELELLNTNQYQFYGDIFVYSDKVALSTFRGKQMSVLIESKDIADTFRAFFDYALKKK